MVVVDTGGRGKVLNVRRRGGLPKSNKCEQGGRESPNFGHVVRT